MNYERHIIFTNLCYSFNILKALGFVLSELLNLSSVDGAMCLLTYFITLAFWLNRLVIFSLSGILNDEAFSGYVWLV